MAVAVSLYTDIYLSISGADLSISGADLSISGVLIYLSGYLIRAYIYTYLVWSWPQIWDYDGKQEFVAPGDIRT